MKTKRIFNQLLKPYKTIAKEVCGSYTDIRVVTGHNFCCYCRTGYDLEIEVPIFEDTMGRKTFYNKMKKRLKACGLDLDLSSEILSFLHELGHIYTYNSWNDFKYILGTKAIQKIQALPFVCNSYKLTNKCFDFYYNLKLEKNADSWAMEFIRNNVEQVQNWDKMLKKNYKKYLPKLLTIK